MANAMKKLKLLHHLNPSSSTRSLPAPPTANTVSASYQQSYPTPPSSASFRPQLQQFSTQAGPTASYSSNANAYSNYLQSARAALHNIHASQPPPPSGPVARETPSNYSYNSFYPSLNPVPQVSTQPSQPPQQHRQPVGQLPSGFLCLTPTSSDHPIQGLYVPASPPPQPQPIPMATVAQQPTYPLGSSPFLSSRPPLSSKPLNLYTSTSRPPLSHHYRTTKTPPRLTREAVAKIGKDSRLARWERVLSYVRAQRAATAAALERISSTPIASEPSNSAGWASYQSASPRTRGIMLDRKRRAEELETIEARNRMLDQIDREEMDVRSLWSGGSAGTNGVDEFVWSEDEEDDVLPMPKGPEPVKIVIDEDEGMWGMEGEEEIKAGEKKEEKKEESGKSWRERIVEELPMLCREGELEGGLGRLVGRRMSTAC